MIAPSDYHTLLVAQGTQLSQALHRPLTETEAAVLATDLHQLYVSEGLLALLRAGEVAAQGIEGHTVQFGVPLAGVGIRIAVKHP